MNHETRSSEPKAQNSELEAGKDYHICFRVTGAEKEVWDSLPSSDKLALTRFFRDAIINYSSMKSVIGLGLRDIAELTNLLKLSYESCKDALSKCEERCKDIEEVRSEYRAKIKELEETVEQLRAEIAKKDAEMAKLRAQLMSLSNLNKLRLLVCTLAEQDKTLEEALKKHGLNNICE